jgi:hypothetical protein
VGGAIRAGANSAGAELAEFVRRGWLEEDAAAEKPGWQHSGFGAYLGPATQDREALLRAARYSARPAGVRRGEGYAGCLAVSARSAVFASSLPANPGVRAIQSPRLPLAVTPWIIPGR